MMFSDKLLRQSQFGDSGLKVIAVVALAKYPVIQLTNSGERPETLGTKEKFWVRLSVPNGSSSHHLFKIGRSGTGENWAERVAAEFARELGLPCADYDFAVFGEQKGVITKRFMSDRAFFLPANTLLSHIISDYDGTKKFDQPLYTIDLCLRLVKRKSILPPLLAKTEDSLSAYQWFIGYLLFDCLIGNTDRHHENWGVVAERLPSREFSTILAPTFDHASSLGRELTDDRRKFRLATNDRRANVKAYCRRARSAFFGEENSRRLTLTNLLEYLIATERETARTWSRKISELEGQFFTSVFDRIPQGWMSPEAADFALEVLRINQDHLREVARD